MKTHDTNRAAEQAADSALAELHTHYDEAAGLLRVIAGTIGYHTRVPPGATVHPTSNSLDYAVRLARSGDAQWRGRVVRIVRTLLPWQETNPVAATYGIWPWYVEEPLDKMSPPDWNWADFCGGHVLDLLDAAAAWLPADLVAEMDAAVGHAAWSIFRRNVGPGYTNIAIAGAAVTLGAGQRLGEPRLVEYGRRRIQAFLDVARATGGFAEYNSPNYAPVVIEQLERLLRLTTDAASREAAETVRRLTWHWIAQYYHVPTAQWAGPQSRAYTDRLEGGPLAFLRAHTGLPLPVHPALADPLPQDKPCLPCPAAERAAFVTAPARARVIHQRFLVAQGELPEVNGTTWLGTSACLGTVSRGSLWYQARPVLAYWRAAEDEPAAMLRLRCLFDDRDFASGAVWCDQEGPRALIGFGFSTDRGTYHPYFDLPADGVFRGRDFRLSWQLDGRGATVCPAGVRAWDLRCGAVRARIRLADHARWNGKPVVAETGTGATVRLDIVLAADGCVFAVAQAQAALACSLEILEAGEAPVADEPGLEADKSATWSTPARQLHVMPRTGPSPTV